MRIASILENQEIEKRVAITPEIANKYVALGFEVTLSKNYAVHLGINDKKYTDEGVKFFKDENEVINDSNVIVQLGLMSDEKSSMLKENQTLIGVLNPFDNKDKLDSFVKILIPVLLSYFVGRAYCRDTIVFNDNRLLL